MTPDACVMVKRSDEPWCDDVAASLKFFECGANHQRFATVEAGLGSALGVWPLKQLSHCGKAP